MRSETGEYTGYTRDVLDRLAHLLDVRYSIYIVPDGEYGYMYAPRKWNGMIKEILDNVSFAELYITINFCARTLGFMIWPRKYSTM